MIYARNPCIVVEGVVHNDFLGTGGGGGGAPMVIGRRDGTQRADEDYDNDISRRAGGGFPYL